VNPTTISSSRVEKTPLIPWGCWQGLQELLDDLGAIVHVPAGEAEALVDELLAGVGFGVGLSQ